MTSKQLQNLGKTFITPAIILFGIFLSILFVLFKQYTYANVILIAVSLLGSYGLFIESTFALFKKQFALDYIAMVAIFVSIITQEYFVASLIALMISSGRTLEQYGVTQAKQSLTKLIDRIPNEVSGVEDGGVGKKIKIHDVKVGMQIFTRRGEVIPLDGVLVSTVTQTDESSLTGEPYLIDKQTGDTMRSGTVNLGDAVIIEITKTQENSAYSKIIKLVKSAQGEKAPLVRLADKYSTIFTGITVLICIFAYFYTHSLQGVLAVLVVATPCPLILATPIALLGGMSSMAKKRIIMKRLATIEVLSRVTTFIFDKTGTITLGKPVISKITVLSKSYTQEQILEVACALERNSLHPLAKTIVAFAKEKGIKGKTAVDTKETIGRGIQGEVSGKAYELMKEVGVEGMVIALTQDKKKIAEIYFEEEIKGDSALVIQKLKGLGLKLSIFTGDKLSSAEKVVSKLGENIFIKAECSPEDKLKGIKELRAKGEVVAMVGDGINDAPALALADVGIVFSNEEQTAASEAADVVFLGTDFSLVYDSLHISKKAVHIALQSIIVGIGLSILCMVFAAIGLIPPIIGAFLQEGIDVLVILNALRASRIS